MKLLLPIDGSELSKKTLEWATDTFKREDVIFNLIYVVKIYPENYTLEIDIEDAKKALSEALCILEKKGCKDGLADWTLGEPVTSISSFAEEKEMDLVVVGSHGRSGLEKFLLGSVSIALLEHCKVPVVIFRNLLPAKKAIKPPHLVPENVVF